jgi:hypothetical protein
MKHKGPRLPAKNEVQSHAFMCSPAQPVQVPDMSTVNSRLWTSFEMIEARRKIDHINLEIKAHVSYITFHCHQKSHPLKHAL